MTLATLSDVLNPALDHGYAIAGLVCLGWEEMRAFTMAAEAESIPVILQAGPSCRAHTPLPILGKMFRYLAESVSVPIVAHLDHAYSIEECRTAIDCGFSSVMYDGSRKPLQHNIDETALVVELAHSAGISCEGEIGIVGYAAGESSKGTDPNEAQLFAQQTKVDAMAISVGNIHLQQDRQGGLDDERINAISAITSIPLVIHGGSGVPMEQRAHLAANSNICKFNIGTELRMVFGKALRSTIIKNPDQFDRIELLKSTHTPIFDETRLIIKNLYRNYS